MVADPTASAAIEATPDARPGTRDPGRKPLEDHAVPSGILFVRQSGIRWERLAQEIGRGSGMSCWRRLRDWPQAGVGTGRTGDTTRFKAPLVTDAQGLSFALILPAAHRNDVTRVLPLRAAPHARIADQPPHVPRQCAKRKEEARVLRGL